MDLDIDALEAVARATDNEPWRQVGDDGREVHSAFDDGADHFVARTVYPSEAAFIAAANPGVVLELVRRLRAAEARTAQAEADKIQRIEPMYEGDIAIEISRRKGNQLIRAGRYVSTEVMERSNAIGAVRYAATYLFAQVMGPEALSEASHD